MNIEIVNTKNYVPAQDYLNSASGAAFQISYADFISFDKIISSILLKLTKYILYTHDKEQALAEAPVICQHIEDIRLLNAGIKAKEPISFFGNNFNKYLEISSNGDLIIGEYLRPYLFMVNANCSYKLFEANFHDIFAEDYSTIFKISPKFSAKLSSGEKQILRRKLRVLNNSLDSTRKIYAKRVTSHLKEKKTLCAAFDGSNQPVLVNPAHWGISYCVNHACEIARMPTSDAPPLFGLMIHAKGHKSDMKTAKPSEIYDFIFSEHKKHPEGHPYGSKDGFIAYTRQTFANKDKKFPMITFDNAWDKFFGDEKYPGWNIKPKAKIDPKKSIVPA